MGMQHEEISKRGKETMSSMSKSNVTGSEEEIGSHLQLYVYRLPKKNHDAMLELNKRYTNTYRKHGALSSEFFQLSDTETLMDFTSIARTVSANQDEEVWVELNFYKDRKYRDDVMAKMNNDEGARPLFGQFMDLVTSGYGTIMGEFSRLRV